MNSTSHTRWGIWRRPEFGLLLANIVVYLTVLGLDPLRNYWSPESFKLIVTETTLLSIFAVGSTLIIIAGGIDLSTGSVIAFSSVVMTTVIKKIAQTTNPTGSDVALWILLCGVLAVVVTSILIGSLHALLITRLNLPPFIATLGTMIGLRSLGRIVAQNSFQYGSDKVSVTYESFHQVFYSVWTFPILGTELQVHWIPLLLFLIVVVSVSFLLRRSVWGRHVYALGGNEQAARLSGIRTDRLKLSVYCLGALLAGVSGIIYASREGQGNSQTMGVGYELNAIAAAVVGGCSLRGGVGTVGGTVLGALFLSLVINGIPHVIKQESSTYEGIVVGVVVVLAVAVNQLRSASKPGEGWWRMFRRRPQG